MKFIRKYSQLADVLETDASTPYMGMVAGTKIVIYASTAEYGDTVHFIEDPVNEYFKPELASSNFILDNSLLDGNNTLS